GLQKIAAEMNDLDTKVLRVRQGIQLIGASELLAKPCLVVATVALGRPEDGPPEDRLLYMQDLMFTASLESFGYLYDRDIPIDSLSCDFDQPDLFMAESAEENAIFRRQRLQVPILAIQT